jgi:hypothetical protein
MSSTFRCAIAALLLSLHVSCAKKNPVTPAAVAPVVEGLIVPALTDPPNNAVGVWQTLKLDWVGCTAATRYHVRVARDAMFDSMQSSSDSVARNEYWVFDLPPLTAFFWKVRATDGHDTTGWSATRKFTTADVVPPPATPVPSAPPNMATMVKTYATFSWQHKVDATQIRIVVAYDAAFADVVYDTTFSYVDAIDLPLLYDTCYHWRMNASNPFGTSAWTSVMTFSTTCVLGSLNAGSSGSIKLVGATAYLANDGASGSGLLIVDVGQPTAPVVLGTCVLGGSWPHDVDVQGSYAYLTRSYDGMSVIDVTSPSSPTAVGFCPMGFAYGVAVSGSCAYVAASDSGLIVVDVSDPAHPVRVATVPVTRAFDVAIGGSYAYVADGSYGLRIVDISVPTSPAIVGNVNVSLTQPHSIAIGGNIAALCTGVDGVKIIDISSPTAPALVGTFPYFADNAAVYQGRLYAARLYGSSRLRIADLATPSSPILIKEYLAGGNDVAVRDSLAYEACGSLQIIKLGH